MPSGHKIADRLPGLDGFAESGRARPAHSVPATCIAVERVTGARAGANGGGRMRLVAPHASAVAIESVRYFTGISPDPRWVFRGEGRGMLDFPGPRPDFVETGARRAEESLA